MLYIVPNESTPLFILVTTSAVVIAAVPAVEFMDTLSQFNALASFSEAYVASSEIHL